MKTKQVDNSQDVIDSRDIIERFEELENELSAAHEEYVEGGGELTFDEWIEDRNDEYLELMEEYVALKNLIEDASDSPDWQYGKALIRETYFTEYVMEMLSDIGDLPKDIPWYIVIDEDATAKNIKQDYFEVDFDGVTYLIRN